MNEVCLAKEEGVGVMLRYGDACVGVVKRSGSKRPYHTFLGGSQHQ